MSEELVDRLVRMCLPHRRGFRSNKAPLTSVRIAVEREFARHLRICCM